MEYLGLADDPVTGIYPTPGSRPEARFCGTLTISDSHPVNKLTLKHLRQALPADVLMLESFCLQHLTGNTAASLSTYLNLFTRVWTLAKTFNEADWYLDLMARMQEVFEDEDEGLEVVDPDGFELRPGDFGTDFTEAIVDRCYTHSLGLGEEEENHGHFKKVKAEFCKFFPFGWNRRRPVHPCPAGCCGPTACHSRKTSLKRGLVLMKQVVYKHHTLPAQNKWTKMDPAFSQTIYTK